MILIVCVDDDYGMGFHHRRQSRDRVVVEEIMDLSDEQKLWVDPYSLALFPKADNLCSDEAFLELAGLGEFCFAECVDVTNWLDKAERVILFRWNRKYPSDIKFPYDNLISQWKLESAKEFSGHSHKRITMEVYKR